MARPLSWGSDRSPGAEGVRRYSELGSLSVRVYNARCVLDGFARMMANGRDISDMELRLMKRAVQALGEEIERISDE